MPRILQIGSKSISLAYLEISLVQIVVINILNLLLQEKTTTILICLVFVFFDVVSTSTTAGQYLRPLGESHAFFTRYRCNAAGQQINDIDNYNLVCEKMESF